jgi:alanine racemase
MSLKKVKTGEFISYGNGYLANENKTIAVIPMGYSQGYSRNLSNRGYILVNGYRAKVIGYVNMNMILADVTNIPGVKVQEEVILIGSQGDFTISVASFSDFTEQINYELLTRIPPAIRRKVIYPSHPNS